MSGGCPADGCTQPAGPLFCTSHGLMVPAQLLDAIRVTWAGGAGEGTLAHCQAIRVAVATVNDQRTEVTR